MINTHLQKEIGMNSELQILADKMPTHIVIEKRLWVGDTAVDINHVDNDLTKPLDYLSAFKKMAVKLEIV